MARSLPQDFTCMRILTFCKVGGIAAGLILAGCEDAPTYRAPEPQISYSTREAGSIARPSNDDSLKLISVSGPEKLASFQHIISTAGEECSFVTSAIFKDGLGGTDEWRVSCADSGNWSVWFHSNRPSEVVSCTSDDCV